MDGLYEYVLWREKIRSRNIVFVLDNCQSTYSKTFALDLKKNF